MISDGCPADLQSVRHVRVGVQGLMGADRASLLSAPTFDPRSLGPQKDERGWFVAYGKAGAPWDLTSMEWDINDEGAYNDETDTFDMRKILVVCPYCERKSAALCSPYTRLLVNEWRWCGMDHQEPYCQYVTRCRCGESFRFTTYTPQ